MAATISRTRVPAGYVRPRPQRRKPQTLPAIRGESGLRHVSRCPAACNRWRSREAEASTGGLQDRPWFGVASGSFGPSVKTYRNAA